MFVNWHEIIIAFFFFHPAFFLCVFSTEIIHEKQINKRLFQSPVMYAGMRPKLSPNYLSLFEEH